MLIFLRAGGACGAPKGVLDQALSWMESPRIIKSEKHRVERTTVQKMTEENP